MTMITPSYLGETIEYSSLHACRSTLEDPTHLQVLRRPEKTLRSQGRHRHRRSYRLLPHRRTQLAHLVRPQIFAGLQPGPQLRRLLDRVGQPHRRPHRQRFSRGATGASRHRPLAPRCGRVSPPAVVVARLVTPAPVVGVFRPVSPRQGFVGAQHAAPQFSNMYKPERSFLLSDK